MNESITPDVEATIAAKVASGKYGTGAEVVREALLALDEREDRDRKYEELRREIQLGIDDLDAGRVSKISSREMLDEIRNEKNLAKQTG